MEEETIQHNSFASKADLLASFVHKLQQNYQLVGRGKLIDFVANKRNFHISTARATKSCISFTRDNLILPVHWFVYKGILKLALRQKS